MRDASSIGVRAAQSARRAVAVTFDDVPLQWPAGEAALAPPPPLEELRAINVKLLECLAGHGIPAVGFVNEKRLHDYPNERARRAILEMWLDAGHELGNHTFSHATPEESSPQAYAEDVTRGEELTRPLLAARGRELRYFRHPKLHTGPSLRYKKALEGFLAGRGYTVAPVTIKHQGWVFAVVYAWAKANGDGAIMRLVVEAYVAHIAAAFEFFERLSGELLGYELRQVLLLHVSELNADHFDSLARMIRERGYDFVTLDHALEDEAYLLPDGYVGARGPSWLHRWAFTKGLPAREEPREPAQIRRLYEAATRPRAAAPRRHIL